MRYHVTLIVTLLVVSISQLGFADETPLLFLPFDEGHEVYCVQGNHGSYSHSGTQAYAYDFDMGEHDNSSSNPIFGRDVLSPFSGTVTEIREGVLDFQNNSSSNISNNYGWGNTIVIRADNSNYYVRFAHLRYSSIPSYLSVGSHVDQGDKVGEVGQTGYSTGPHLHMQLQTATRGDSVPFDFVEGTVEQYEYVESELAPNRYIIENDGRVNLGAPLENPNNWTNGAGFEWWSWAPMAHGDDYVTSNESGARFYWGFTMAVSGRFNIYANCRGISNRDRNAHYRFYQNGVDISRIVDQRYMGHEYEQLGDAILYNGRRYNVRVRQTSGRVCADSIILEMR